jgi:hypothetical protein
MRLLALLVAALSAPIHVVADQGGACKALTSLTVPQRTYAQVNIPAFGQRVYFYAPDIKSSFGGSFSAFTVWVIEGVYTKPFGQPTGSLEERAFERIRGSRNVIVTAVPVERNSNTKRTPVTIARQPYIVELVKVNTSLGGTDSVTLNLCR